MADCRQEAQNTRTNRTHAWWVVIIRDPGGAERNVLLQWHLSLAPSYTEQNMITRILSDVDESIGVPVDE